VISFRDASEKEMKIDMTGTPAQPGVWCELGAPEIEAKDPKGKLIMDKLWWDEPGKKLYRSLNSPADDPNGQDLVQVREILPDGRMACYSRVVRRKDGQSCEFKSFFKRV
jgi:hypothetical protein